MKKPILILLCVLLTGCIDFDEVRGRALFILASENSDFLQKRNDGLYYLPNEQTAFTGLASSEYPDGKRYEVHQLRRGRYKFFMSYWPNGQVKMLVPFRNGIIVRKWYENGNMEVEKLATKSNLVTEKYWYPSGVSKLIKTRTKDGTPVREVSSYENGQVEAVRTYDQNGNLVKVDRYDMSGNAK